MSFIGFNELYTAPIKQNSTGNAIVFKIFRPTAIDMNVDAPPEIGFILDSLNDFCFAGQLQKRVDASIFAGIGSSYICCLVKNDSHVVSSLLLVENRADSPTNPVRGKDNYYIYNVCTPPFYGGEGYLRILMTRVIGHIRLQDKVSSIYLNASPVFDVWGITLSARILIYAKLGFRIVKGEHIAIYDGVYDKDHYFVRKDIRCTVIGNSSGSTVEVIRQDGKFEIYPVNLITDSYTPVGLPNTYGPRMEYIDTSTFIPLTYSVFTPQGIEIKKMNTISNQYKYPPQHHKAFACHGGLVTDNTFTIPNNVELIHFTGFSSVQTGSMSYFDILQMFINNCKGLSITTLQKVFPPAARIPITYPTDIPYLNTVAKYGNNTIYVNPAVVFYEEFSNTRLMVVKRPPVKRSNGNIIKNNLFYINCMKSGDTYYDYTIGEDSLDSATGFCSSLPQSPALDSSHIEMLCNAPGLPPVQMRLSEFLSGISKKYHDTSVRIYCISCAELKLIVPITVPTKNGTELETISPERIGSILYENIKAAANVINLEALTMNRNTESLESTSFFKYLNGLITIAHRLENEYKNIETSRANIINTEGGGVSSRYTRKMRRSYRRRTSRGFKSGAHN